MTLAAGGRDILLAYQPVGPNAKRLATLMRMFPNAKFSTLVDDARNLAAISRVAVAENIVLPLYVDINVGMNRTGILPGPPRCSCTAICARPRACRRPACTGTTATCVPPIRRPRGHGRPDIRAGLGNARAIAAPKGCRCPAWSSAAPPPSR